MSRFWCLLVASVVNCAAQICGARVENPHMLIFVSALTGRKFIAPSPSSFVWSVVGTMLVGVTCELVGYGFLFGVFPSLVVQVFGINGLSTNWGFMTLAPVISGNIFNILYGNHPYPRFLSIFENIFPTLHRNWYQHHIYLGKIFDSHSIILPDGTRQCFESIHCYNVAYWVTFGASLLSVVLGLWSIRYDNATKAKAIRLERGRGVGRDAWDRVAYQFNERFEGSRFRKYIINKDGYKCSYIRYHRSNIDHRFVLSVGNYVLAWLAQTLCY